jgi:hypothetical protein
VTIEQQARISIEAAEALCGGGKTLGAEDEQRDDRDD